MTTEEMLIGLVIISMMLIGSGYLAVSNMQVSSYSSTEYAETSSQFQHVMVRMNTTMGEVSNKIKNFQDDLDDATIPYILFQAFPSLLDITVSILNMMGEIPQLMLTYFSDVWSLPWWFITGVTLIILIYAGIKVFYIMMGRTPV